jgi:predicted O-methyltransferase YrrM
MEWLLLLVCGATLAISAYTFHKVRKIHMASYAIHEAASQTQKETLALFAQMQAYDGLMRLLQLRAPLPPLRGWAASPDFLLIIAQHVVKNKPKVIVECSSGSSTLVLARCCELNGSGHVYSLEHDPHYGNITRERLAEQGLSAWATVIDAPLIMQEKVNQPWYDLAGLPADIGPIDMLVVDGPPLESADQARYPALPLLADRFTTGSAAFLDDANRAEEKKIVARWVLEQSLKNLEHPYCEKGCAKLS